MIRVLLADDQALVRAGFRALLESADDISIVAEAQNGGAAVALVRELTPDVVVIAYEHGLAEPGGPAGSRAG
jgi:DNA-binding NarL/FixJ family response regulator